MILDAIENLGADQQEITVAAVVAEAQLSRSSFYSQFSELGDVAVQLVRETRSRVYEALEANPGSSAPRVAIRALIAEFDERRLLYRAVLGGSSSMQTARSICEVLIEWVYRDISRVSPAGGPALNTATFFAAGVFGVLTNWVLSEDPDSPEEIELQIFTLLPAWLDEVFGTD